jgi:hypothetical protein
MFFINVIRVIKSSRMWWEGHVARMGNRRISYILLIWHPKWKVDEICQQVEGSGRGSSPGRHKSPFSWLKYAKASMAKRKITVCAGTWSFPATCSRGTVLIKFSCLHWDVLLMWIHAVCYMTLFLETTLVTVLTKNRCGFLTTVKR